MGEGRRPLVVRSAIKILKLKKSQVCRNRERGFFVGDPKV